MAHGFSDLSETFRAERMHAARIWIHWIAVGVMVLPAGASALLPVPGAHPSVRGG